MTVLENEIVASRGERVDEVTLHSMWCLSSPEFRDMHRGSLSLLPRHLLRLWSVDLGYSSPNNACFTLSSTVKIVAILLMKINSVSVLI